MNPYIFVIFLFRGGPDTPPPPLDLRMDWKSDIHIINTIHVHIRTCGPVRSNTIQTTQLRRLDETSNILADML